MGAFLNPGSPVVGNRITRSRGLRVGAALWLLIILVISVMPLGMKNSLHTVGRLHDALHFLAFFIAAFLMTLGAPGWRSRLMRGMAAFIFALTTEYLERTLYLHVFEWGDVRIDALGIVAGLLVSSLLGGRTA